MNMIKINRKSGFNDVYINLDNVTYVNFKDRIPDIYGMEVCLVGKGCLDIVVTKEEFVRVKKIINMHMLQ